MRARARTHKHTHTHTQTHTHTHIHTHIMHACPRTYLLRNPIHLDTTLRLDGSQTFTCTKMKAVLNVKQGYMALLTQGPQDQTFRLPLLSGRSHNETAPPNSGFVGTWRVISPTKLFYWWKSYTRTPGPHGHTDTGSQKQYYFSNVPVWLTSSRTTHKS